VPITVKTIPNTQYTPMSNDSTIEYLSDVSASAVCIGL